MTTIAYRDGVMAADTALTQYSLYEGKFTKITRLNRWDGIEIIVGVAGTPAHQIAFCSFLETGALSDRPDLDKDAHFNAIAVDPAGNVELYDQHLIAVPIDEAFHAFGSGKELAIGAMATGMSAEDAVRIACQYDIYSSEPVTIETVAAFAEEAA